LPAIGVDLNMSFCRAIREVARERTDLSEEQLDDLLDARKIT